MRKAGCQMRKEKVGEIGCSSLNPVNHAFKQERDEIPAPSIQTLMSGWEWVGLGSREGR